MAEVNSNSTMKRDFSRVELTLENVLIPAEKLSETPSMHDGLDKEVETDLRVLGCELIQTAGILLKLPQVAMATAQVVFQRFYYVKSFIKHNMEVVAMASLVLASKIEECPRRNRDVINVFHHIKQVRNKRTIHPLVLDQHYINLKNQVIKAERRVLKELGFAVHVKHPHKIIVMYLEVLESTGKRQLVQCAWNFMNDSLRSDVFMRFHPESIACACIYLAARQCQVPLPNNPPWFWLFSGDEEEIQQICLSILRLYARQKPSLEKLEKAVEELKRKQQLEKSKAKGIVSDIDTPNSSSRHNSPKVLSPNPASLSLLQAMKKEKEKFDNNGANVPKHDNGEATNIKQERDTEVKKTQHAKKRSHDESEDSERSAGSARSARSKTGSTASHSSRNSGRSRTPKSRSRSPSSSNNKRRRDLSPVNKKQHRAPADPPVLGSGHDKHKKQKYRSRSRSYSRSPVRSTAGKPSKKSRREDYKDSRDSFKDKELYRGYREKDRDYHRDRDMKERDYYRDAKDRRRSYTPEKDRHRSRKHRSNGHRDSPLREKLDKHRR
ncbi:cyclin-L1 [Elysia marginata]|uniref:Cyclin-L1 n=1 Tax=Elysia marginata TaxID=1093978 RepID=A0AAV4GI09_9GAST|nr:cyclin-L1 [Elysia marginata]